MNDKPSKEMIRVDRLLDKIDLLESLIDEDISLFVRSLDPKLSPTKRAKYREAANKIRTITNQIAEDFSHE